MSTNLTGNGLLGLTVPSPGGDSGTWDTVLNDDTFTEVAKTLYAAREDRNISILGGGKIEWDESGNQVSFSSDIVIYDHITNKTTTVETSDSPITLDAANKVAYIEKTREPTSNETPSPTVVAAGSLPNAVDDNGIIALFHRTSDGTLYVPWARKEILDGDHWNFGTSLTWFERLATTHKPGFHNLSSDATQVIIPGSADNPAVVVINGKLYANTSDSTMDIDTAGRDGLDTGSKAAETPYYLYAIPALSGRGFDTVCSVTAPGTGPTGFSDWSYLGAFSTYEASTSIYPFKSDRGILIYDTAIDATSHTGDTNYTTKTITNMPTTVKKIWAHATYSGTQTGYNGEIRGQTTLVGAVVPVYLMLQVSGLYVHQNGWVPIFTAQTIYLKTGHASNTINFYFMGWQENPMEWQ